jgi:hypothetical protein
VENLGDTSYEALYIGIKGKLATASNGGGDPTDEEAKRIAAEYLMAVGKP